MKTETGYIYLDEENGETLLFSKLSYAKQCGWPEEEDWVQEDENEWRRGSACRIIKREVDEDV